LALHSVFKMLPLLLLAGLMGCSDLPRDNVLDPKNPDSYSNSNVLVEAFVNLANPAPYNRWALESLTRLKQTCGAPLIVCEYHRDILVDTMVYDDPYNADDTQYIFQFLQDRYVAQNQNVGRVVPDVYVNGALHRFVGAYAPNSLKEQIEPLVLELLAEHNGYLLEPDVRLVNDSTLQVRCRIAGLGDRAVPGSRLRIVFLKRFFAGDLELHSAIRLVWPGITVKEISKGNYRTLDAGDFSFADLPDGIVFALTTEDELTVLQATYFDCRGHLK